MGKCLVTTLPESVSDDTLLKIGNLKISVRKRGNNPVNFKVYSTKGKAVSLTIIGNAYFTDSTGMANYGKVRSNLNSGIFYLSSGDVDVIIDNKYDVTRIYSTETHLGFTLEELRYSPLTRLDCRGDVDLIGDTEALKGKAMTLVGLSGTSTTGHLSDFAGMKELTNLVVNYTGIVGDLADLATCTSLRYFTAQNCKITGNVNALNNNFTKFYVRGTYVTGSLSAFAEMTNLKSLNIANTSIAGDTSALAGLKNLTSFVYDNCPNITGNWPLS